MSSISLLSGEQDCVERGKGGSSARSTNGRFVGMFSYGSNNERQLGARVKNPRLRGCPAYIDGYMRIFGSSSPMWSGGSVASIAPKEGGRVYGCFYLMTPQEVEILDVYERVKEGDYFKKAVMVEVRVSRKDADGVCSSGEGGDETGEGGDRGGFCGGHETRYGYVSTPAITYIMSQQCVETFVHPSAAYLTSVYRTLTENFSELSDKPVDVCDFSGTKSSEWTYPECRNLPLDAFLVEIGLREDPPWTFPLVLKPLVVRLEGAGIMTTDALCDAAVRGVLVSKLGADRNNAVQGAGTRTVADIMSKSRLNGIEEQAVAASTPPEGTGNPLYEAESVQRWAATVAMPEITDQTMAIISRLISP